MEHSQKIPQEWDVYFVPNANMARIDRPGTNSTFYTSDLRQFSAKGMKNRRSILRLAYRGEFDPVEPIHGVITALWIFVVRWNGWHFVIPFWRGVLPIEKTPNNDEGIEALVFDCTNRGGCARPNAPSVRHFG